VTGPRRADSLLVSHANPNRPTHPWADHIIDVREYAAQYPLPSLLGDGFTVLQSATGALQGWRIEMKIRDFGNVLLVTSPSGERVALAHDRDPYDDAWATPGLRTLIRRHPNSAPAKEPHWSVVPVLHAALTAPDAWLTCRDQDLPPPASEEERLALLTLSQWSSVGVTALWQVRRWNRYHIPTAYHLAQYRFNPWIDDDKIRARAPYVGLSQRSYSRELPPRVAAAWIKHAWCLPHEVVMDLHAAGVRPRDAVPALHEMARVGAWMGRRWGKRSPGRDDGCGIFGHTEYTSAAYLALVTAPGLRAENAVLAARAGLSAAEIRTAHESGSLYTTGPDALRTLAALRSHS
jgi:hypothetical protein